MPRPHAPPPPPPLEEGDVFGPLGHWVMFVLRAPRRHKVLAALVLMGCAVVGVAAALTLPQKYQVDATILAQRNPLLGTLSNPGVNREWDAPTRAAREVVIRRDNLVALCKETDFARRYLATRAPAAVARDWLLANVLRQQRTEAQLLDDLVSSLETRLFVAVSHEGAVNIGFTWSDPELAYLIVQAAVKGFLAARSESEIGAMGEAIAILQGHDARVQSEIAEAIQQLDAKEQALRIRNGPPRTPRPRAAVKVDEETQRLQTVLAGRRRALSDVEDFRQRRLAELQAQLSQQVSVYAAEHPTIVGTRQALAGLNQPSSQAAELRNEIAQLERKLSERTGGAPVDPSPAAGLDDLAAARARLLEQTDPRLDYERRQLDALLRRHSSLLDRVESARIERDTARSAFDQRYTVITPPRRPKGPLKPYAAIFVVGGLVAGLLAACAAAAAADLLRGRLVEPWQVESALGVPLLGSGRR